MIWKTARNILLLIVASLLIYGASGKVLPISPGQIKSISIHDGNTDETIEVSEDRYASFADAYNSAKYFRNDIGTTWPLSARVTLKDKSVLFVAGGVGDILYSDRGRKHSNIKSRQLGEWFSFYQRKE